MKKTLLLGIAVLSLSSVKAVAEEVRDAIVNEGAESMEMPLDTVYSLQEVTVNANIRKAETSPLSLTTVSRQRIFENVAAPQFTEMMKGNSSVYATAETGSYGDAKLNIRGFKQDNIAIMLNGIPIQGLTSGSMYWSNWMGLADATYALQIQKGIGGSLLADCAMGGLVNIVTRTSGMHPQTELGLYSTQYGTTKGTVSWDSGMLRGGWGVNLSLAYVNGTGFADCTSVETFSYMLSVSKILDRHNSLLFTALGSPEHHDQRNTKMSKDEIDRYGVRYNKNWGTLYGRDFSTSRNHYFKPYFTLQHIHDGERLSMRNSLYLAIANGGGRYSETQQKGISSYMKDGQIDFQQVLAANTTWSGANTLSPADGIAAQNVITDYLSGHTQFGAIASADYKLTDNWKISGGLQYQLYKTWEKEEIVDLLGADFWYENYAAKSLCGQNGRNSILHVGDQVRTHNGKTTHHISAAAGAEYTNDNIVANASFSLFNGNYRRHDEYNYVEGNRISDWATGWGCTVKGGLLWKFNPHSTGMRHSAFLNAAFNSRLPYSGAYFASSNNAITKDVHNEKNLMAEVGYRAAWATGSMELSGYIASWRNKTLTSNKYKQLEDVDAARYQISGLNALHMGLEFSLRQQLTSWLDFSAYASHATWKWKNDVEASIYDDYTGQEVQKVKVYADGLHVGDAPQTQLGARLEAKLRGGFYVNADLQYNARMYADFEPSSRTSADHLDAYQLPDYSLLGATIGWRTIIGKETRLNIFATGTNLLDKIYIERGTDGTTHDITSFRGYWGAPRMLTLGAKISF